MPPENQEPTTACHGDGDKRGRESSATAATLLGTGTSVGVPVIGCDCEVCTSSDRRNVRTRCSLYLQSPETSLLIDSSPDLREQALREGIRVVDAVLYTHAHLDHIAGFDELRAFCWRREDPLPLYAGPDTHEHLHRMFPWAMENTNRGYIRPEARVLSGPFTFADLTITPVPVDHAGIETYGFRIDLPGRQSLAYLSDVKRIPESSRALLENLDVLIIDALRPEAHGTHMSIAEALATAEDLQPARTLLTHLTHDVEFTRDSAALPDSVSFACDGLKLLFQGPDPCAIVEPSISAAP